MIRQWQQGEWRWEGQALQVWGWWWQQGCDIWAAASWCAIIYIPHSLPTCVTQHVHVYPLLASTAHTLSRFWRLFKYISGESGSAALSCVHAGGLAYTLYVLPKLWADMYLNSLAASWPFVHAATTCTNHPSTPPLNCTYLTTTTRQQ